MVVLDFGGLKCGTGRTRHEPCTGEPTDEAEVHEIVRRAQQAG
jgi:hypothetical protein